MWVYSKAGRAYKTSTRNFGAERDFYGKDLDDRITDHEGAIQASVKELIDGSPQVLEDVELVAEIISHLEIRSKTLRLGFGDVMGQLVANLGNKLSDPSVLKNAAAAYLKSNPDYLRDELYKRGISPSLLKSLGPFLDNIIDNHMNSYVVAIAPQLEAALKTVLGEKVKEISKTSHVKALSKSVTGKGRAVEYSQLKFSYFEPMTPCILPDCMAVFYDGSRFRSFAMSPKEIHSIILPLRPDLVLIGERSDSEIRVDFENLNANLAACSSKNFVAANESDEFHRLTDSIGESSRLLDKTEIDEVVDQAFEVLFSTQ